ncbi:hypothetical protein GCM10007063_18390 [Lentibacillus kapialis]|uniref:Uncharacterized protein n=1 Tax=Lentibacillus kapialis TaxID=340214 RepID=A0A917PWE3_9BACI|nr:hypothetical protein GCM10007063_18390 [Lentibacillus kapialis]
MAAKSVKKVGFYHAIIEEDPDENKWSDPGESSPDYNGKHKKYGKSNPYRLKYHNK